MGEAPSLHHKRHLRSMRAIVGHAPSALSAASTCRLHSKACAALQCSPVAAGIVVHCHISTVLRCCSTSTFAPCDTAAQRTLLHLRMATCEAPSFAELSGSASHPSACECQCPIAGRTEHRNQAMDSDGLTAATLKNRFGAWRQAHCERLTRVQPSAPHAEQQPDLQCGADLTLDSAEGARTSAHYAAWDSATGC